MTVDPHARTLAVAGVPTRWVEAGAGPPVVLVHGLPTSPATWRRVLPRLHGVRALALELVGYGESIPAGAGRDLSVAAQAAHLVRWLDALGVRRAVLVGHDVGGGVAQVVATRHAERCAGLVLTNSVAYDAWPVPEVRLLRALHPITRRLPDAVVRRLIFGMLMRRGHDDRRLARESRDVHWAPYARHGGARALVRQMRALHARDTRAVAPDLPRLRTVPSRLVWGAADPFLPVRLAERLADDLGAPLHRIEGGRHFVPEDHPDEIAAAVHAVVRDADLRGAAS